MSEIVNDKICINDSVFWNEKTNSERMKFFQTLKWVPKTEITCSWTNFNQQVLKDINKSIEDIHFLCKNILT